MHFAVIIKWHQTQGKLKNWLLVISIVPCCERKDNKIWGRDWKFRQIEINKNGRKLARFYWLPSHKICAYIILRQYYIITEVIVQRPLFNITADLKLWGWVFVLITPEVILWLYKYIGVKELCPCNCTVKSYCTYMEETTL